MTTIDLLANRVCRESSDDRQSVWPIRTEEDYRTALEVVDRLAVKGEEDLTSLESAQLEVFTRLIEAYEKEHYPFDLPRLPPIELLKKLMAENDMSESDLGRLLGDRTLGHRVLSGERDLSKNHIRILSERFKLDPGVFFEL